jgi:hypothetical protein
MGSVRTRGDERTDGLELEYCAQSLRHALGLCPTLFCPSPSRAHDLALGQRDDHHRTHRRRRHSDAWHRAKRERRQIERKI